MTMKMANQVLDNLPGLGFRAINDGQWTFAYASKGARELLGYTPEQLMDSKQLRKMIPREDQQANQTILSRITRKNPHYKAIYRVYTRSGECKWVREEGFGFFSDEGALMFIDGLLMDVTEHKLREEALLKENNQLRSTIQHRHRLDNLIGDSLAMREMYDLIMKAAGSQATVVVNGESGTGKELASRAIHNLSDKRDAPFIVVNCGAIAPNLLESEFFGYKKGAFSGAVSNRKGLLDAANGGTLFLDEIGEISLNLQIKLLRVLDGEGYIPVGETSVKHSHFRLIVATHRNLEELVRSGRMREDFYYRINAIRLRIPPLRERKEDILILADYFLEKYAENDPRPCLTDKEKKMLMGYSWPGNVRELQNVINRYLLHGSVDLTGELLLPRRKSLYELFDSEKSEFDATEPRPPDLPSPPISPTHHPAANADTFVKSAKTLVDLGNEIEQTEKKVIFETLQQYRWHIGKSAEALGFSRRTMQRRMKKYNLSSK